MSPSPLTAILKRCFGGSSPSTPSSTGAMWVWWVLPFLELDEDMSGTVAAISRRRGGEPCLPFGVCLFFFPLLHSNLVWCHMVSHIWGKYHCFNFRKYIVQIHVSTRTSRVACCMKRKKGILVKQTLAHICFLFISLPMPWALAGTHYILASSRIWKSPTQRKDFYTEERKPPQRMVSVKKKQNLLRGDYCLLFCKK